MMTFTPDKIWLLQLPVILSDAAWQQAIYIKNCTEVEITERLNEVFQSIYHELRVRPSTDQSDRIYFNVYGFSPCGNRQYRVRLDLCLLIERCEDGEPCSLRVTLLDEATL
jgi:hypothetical protein